MPTDKIVDPNRGVRNVLIGLGLCVWPVGLMLAFLEDSVPHTPAERIIILGVMFLMGCAVILMAMIWMPKVILDHEGVTLQILRKKTCPWKEIQQAGRYYRNRKAPTAMNFNLVLVFPGGSPKQPGKDRGFLNRNYFKAAILPNERHILDFIRARYGNLDFDNYDQVNEFEKKAYQLDQT